MHLYTRTACVCFRLLNYSFRQYYDGAAYKVNLSCKGRSKLKFYKLINLISNKCCLQIPDISRKFCALGLSAFIHDECYTHVQQSFIGQPHIVNKSKMMCFFFKGDLNVIYTRAAVVIKTTFIFRVILF